jgi:SAM-dependent methyltransferase
MSIDLRRPLRIARSRGKQFAADLTHLVPRRAHQLANDTEPDRYPEIFRSVATVMRSSGTEAGSILSYGCSTGEECFSLRGYLPEASIVGADVRRAARAQASARNHDPAIRFIPARESDLASNGPYDAIFAMSVLCRYPATLGRRSCSRIYPFKRFEAAATTLDRVLRPGGLLVIYNANFRFTDTSAARRYESLPVPGLDDSGFVDLFSSSNQRLEDQVYPHAVFRKYSG